MAGDGVSTRREATSPTPILPGFLEGGLHRPGRAVMRRQPVQLVLVQAFPEQEGALGRLARPQGDLQLLREARLQSLAAGAVQRRSRPQAGRIRRVAVTADEGAAIAGIRGILELRPADHRAGEGDAVGELAGRRVDRAQQSPFGIEGSDDGTRRGRQGTQHQALIGEDGEPPGHRQRGWSGAGAECGPGHDAARTAWSPAPDRHADS